MERTKLYSKKNSVEERGIDGVLEMGAKWEAVHNPPTSMPTGGRQQPAGRAELGVVGGRQLHTLHQVPGGLLSEPLDKPHSRKAGKRLH